MDSQQVKQILAEAFELGLLSTESSYKKCLAHQVNTANSILKVLDLAGEPGIKAEEISRILELSKNSVLIFLRELETLGLAACVELKQQGKPKLWGIVEKLQESAVTANNPATQKEIVTIPVVDRNLRLYLSKQFVYGQLYNSKQLLLKNNLQPEIETEVSAITHIMTRLQYLKSTAGLVGLLGAAYQHYWSAFQQTIKYKEFVHDSICFNLMRSYLIDLLYLECQNAITLAEIAPKTTIMHRLLYKDLACEFIPYTVDALARKFINLNRCSLKDFDNGLKPVFKEKLKDSFDSKMSTEIIYPKKYPDGKPTRYRDCIKKQAIVIKRSLAGDDVTYHALLNT